MVRPRLNVVLLSCVAAWLGLVSMGCSPKIGDDCTSSTNCSTNGDRLCDTTQPGGYCTIFNCEPDSCPDEAQCVAFDQNLDPVCTNSQQWARFERTFCMRRCSGDGDCRSGYICFDLHQQPNSWGASVVDTSPDGYKICISPSSVPTEDPAAGPAALCQPYDGGFPDAQVLGQDEAASAQEAGEEASAPLDGGLDASVSP